MQKLFTDNGISGATTKRPALLRCLKTLKRGDSLTVWKRDRLGRSLHNLIAMLDDLKQRGLKFRSLTGAIDAGKGVRGRPRVILQTVTAPHSGRD